MTISDFQKTVDKEQIKQFPIRHYEGEIVVVNTLEHFLQVLPEINKCSICGIDTETLPCFKKGRERHPVALLQIATEKRVYLIRLFKIGYTQEVTDFLENPNICKVGIGCTDDLHALSRFGKIVPKNMVDLNSYCKQLGFESIGAKKLSALVLGFTITKRQQTSNWENEELTKAQILYAATDAWICREIYLKLYESLLNTSPNKRNTMDTTGYKFNHRKEIQMRMSDLDAIGHVNNGVQYLYFDIGRVDYLKNISEESVNWKDPELVIVHTECDFKRSILFTDHVFVETKTIEVRKKSIRMLQQIVDEEGNVKSICYSILSGFDIKANTSKEISKMFREKLMEFENLK